MSGISYLEIRNANRELIGILDTFQSVIWETTYYSTGAFEIYITANLKNMLLLQIGHYVTRIDDENIGVIEKVSVEYEERYGKMIVATGRFAKSLLDRRLIYSLVGGSVTGKLSILPTISSGLVENAARNLVKNHIISSEYTARNVSFIKLGESKNIQKKIVDEDGDYAQKQTSFGNLLTYTDEMLQEFGMGARLAFNRDDYNLYYEVLDGADRSRNNTQGNNIVIFSQEFDNLLSSNYSRDTTTLKNTALIGGEGEGVDRFCTMIGVNASGLERREVWVDASSQSKFYETGEERKEYSDQEYLSLIKSAAQQTLSEFQITEIYKGEINVNNSIYEFRKDYNIGDIVTIEDKELGIYFNPRIISVMEAQNEQGYSISVSYGN